MALDTHSFVTLMRARARIALKANALKNAIQEIDDEQAQDPVCSERLQK